MGHEHLSARLGAALHHQFAGTSVNRRSAAIGGHRALAVIGRARCLGACISCSACGQSYGVLVKFDVPQVHPLKLLQLSARKPPTLVAGADWTGVFRCMHEAGRCERRHTSSVQTV
jgi:hypothetical protein